MNLPAWLSATLRTLLVIAVPIILIATPLYIFVTPSFIRHEYNLRGFPPSERFNEAERLRLSDVIVGYLRSTHTVEEMATMRTDTGEVAMRPEEVQHIVDVKQVTDGFFIAQAVALVLALVGGLLLWRSGQGHRLSMALRQGVWVAGGLIVFIVLFSLLDFDLFFTRFHQVFFTAESWIFYVDDTLIQLYPLPLWVDAVWKIGVTILAEAGLVYLLAGLLERRV